MQTPTPIALIIRSPAQVGCWAAQLRSEGYYCAGPHDPEQGLAALQAMSPNVVVVIRLAWDVHGLHLIQDMRRSFGGPIFAISARPGPNAAIECLDAGASDDLIEPFDADELLARIRSKIRRHDQAVLARKTIRYRGLSIDLDAQKVMFMEQPIDLTRTEYKVLALLARFQGRPAPYSAFLIEIWSHRNMHAMQYLRISILNIRQKLFAAGVPGRTITITTKPKYGYALEMTSPT